MEVVNPYLECLVAAETDSDIVTGHDVVMIQHYGHRSSSGLRTEPMSWQQTLTGHVLLTRGPGSATWVAVCDSDSEQDGQENSTKWQVG